MDERERKSRRVYLQILRSMSPEERLLKSFELRMCIYERHLAKIDAQRDG